MTDWVDCDKVRFSKGNRGQLVSWTGGGGVYTISSIDPSELAIAVEQPAPDKPNNIFTDLPLSDLRTACKKIMTPKWMEY
jgi:hypothetical protein